MGACNPFHLDAGACGAGIFGGVLDGLTGWVFGLPVWLLVVVATVVLAAAYRQGGIVALAAAAGGIGILVGRRSVRVTTPSGGNHRLTAVEIMALQRALVARHLYPGKIDGKFGAKSEAGLIAFQRSRGEPATGRPTPAQLAALGVRVAS